MNFYEKNHDILQAAKINYQEKIEDVYYDCLRYCLTEYEKEHLITNLDFTVEGHANSMHEIFKHVMKTQNSTDQLCYIMRCAEQDAQALIDEEAEKESQQ